MPDSIMVEIAKNYCDTQDDLLELVDGLTDKQIAWTPNATTPSIGFHLWHMARWADYLQEMINGCGSQIWEKENLATRWDLATASLGYAQTGMSMDDNAAMTLHIPGKDLLLDYSRRAFALAQQAVGMIGDEAYFKVYEDCHGAGWHGGHIGPIITTWLTHDNRHTGMIECLVGMQGMHGTADS